MKVADWYSNADFAVHADIKSHTGGVLTMGKGETQTIPTKQNINTKFSTEEELVAANYVWSI